MERSNKMSEKITKSTGNVFKDIGLPEPDAVLIRSEIMSQITEIIKERGLTQKAAGKLLGLSQGRVSELMCGKLSLFSLEHLYKLLNYLERDVEIIIKPRTRYETKASTTLIFKS